MYGPHQYPEKIIPKFINQLTRGRKVTLHGTGANKRNFLFVEDVARAFEIAAFHPAAAGEVFNISGEPSTWNTFLGHYARMSGASLRRLPAGCCWCTSGCRDPAELAAATCSPLRGCTVASASP